MRAADCRGPTRARAALRGRRLRCKAWIGVVLMVGVLAAGCAKQRYRNTAAWIDRFIPYNREGPVLELVKCCVLYPLRDMLVLEPLWRGLDPEAWDVVDGQVPDGSFYTNRTPEELTPARVARGAAVDPPPQPPLRVLKVVTHSGSLSFTGQDARGDTYQFKPDVEGYPELGSGAEIVASRIFWALGYHVPPSYLVTLSGTGDQRFDGKRGVASRHVPNVLGHFQFDWFRHRRELRALRIAAAWVNDTDRVSTNTLVSVEPDGRARFYLYDFNSALGSWQGRPKAPWRGHKHAGDVFWLVAGGLSLGVLHPEPDPQAPIVSPAVGRFSADRFHPLTWAPQVQNGAFDCMTRGDMAWMVEKIRRLEREHIEAIVAEAGYSRPEDAAYIVETLMRRRAVILDLLDK